MVPACQNPKVSIENPKTIEFDLDKREEKIKMLTKLYDGDTNCSEYGDGYWLKCLYDYIFHQVFAQN